MQTFQLRRWMSMSTYNWLEIEIITVRYGLFLKQTKHCKSYVCALKKIMKKQTPHFTTVFWLVGRNNMFDFFPSYCELQKGRIGDFWLKDQIIADNVI